jgi:nucleoid-associated protein YgaU
VAELVTARVQRGDSLWRISTTVYGEGTRYTQLYDANASQIRDPDLIYPGQVLVVPKQDAPKPSTSGERRR